jgi:TolA-binding protein
MLRGGTMGDASSHTVLEVVGDPDFAELSAVVLNHPNLRVDVASSHQELAAAMEGKRYDLVLTSTGVGRHGPLVIGDAVRGRDRGVPILVLHGPETTDSEVEEHRRRGIPGFSYFDLSGLISELEVGAQLRARVLEMLGLAEDPAAATEWQRRVRAEWASDEGVTADEASLAPTSPAGAQSTPPPLASMAITEADLEFARHIAVQMRNVDYRETSIDARPAATFDRTTQLLRDEIRQLTRDLARLAQVYHARMRRFDGVDRRLKEAKEQYHTLEGHLKEVRERLRAEQRDRARERDEHHAQVAELTTRVQGSEQVLQQLARKVGEQSASSETHQREIADRLTGLVTAVEVMQRTTEELLHSGQSLTDTGGRRVAVPDREVQPPKAKEAWPRAGQGLRLLSVLVLGAALGGAALLLARGRPNKGGQSPRPTPGLSAEPLTVVPVPVSDVGDSKPTTAPEPGAALRQEMMEAANEKRWHEVVQIADRLRTKRALDAGESFTYATSLRRLGQYSQAEQAFWVFIKKFSNDARIDDAWFWQADILMRLDRGDEAMAIYDMLIHDGAPAVSSHAGVLRDRLIGSVAGAGSGSGLEGTAANGSAAPE